MLSLKNKGDLCRLTKKKSIYVRITMPNFAHVLRVLLCSAPLVLVPPAQAEDKPAAPAKAVLTVVVTVPTEVQWSTSIAASGNLQAWQEAVVAAGGAFLNDGDRVQIVAPVPSAVTP
jgi:hypothetical protein